MVFRKVKGKHFFLKTNPKGRKGLLLLWEKLWGFLKNFSFLVLNSE